MADENPQGTLDVVGTQGFRVSGVGQGLLIIRKQIGKHDPLAGCVAVVAGIQNVVVFAVAVGVEVGI